MADATNEGLFARAQRVIPGGVNSPVRAFRSVGGTPFFVARGEGGRVWDVEGTEYIDFVQSYGASIVGHAHPAVVEAVRAAAGDGSTFGAPTEREVLLAEVLCDRVAGCDMVRLVSSGTEATMSAIRLARGATGRDAVVKFAGCYHGHSDGLLAAAGSGMASLALPDSAGVPAEAVAHTRVVPYNVIPEIGDDVACVIVEPVAANMGLVAPADGFLAGLRAACDTAGALLIFDEVITGFRIDHRSASGLFGVTPDLWTFGKVIGGGLPIGAFGGRRDVMEHLAPLGSVYQAGTLSGNPLATAAGLAVLDLLTEEAYADLCGRARRFGALLRDAITAAGAPVSVPVVGSLVGLFLPAENGAEPVTDYRTAQVAAGSGRYPDFFHGMRERGVFVAPGAYEAMFPSLAHSDDDFERAATAAGEAVACLA
ncbi:MAG: glutamate-1-semialdehyde 2,1-aminomutase [Acidimicrobiales bacterium]